MIKPCQGCGFRKPRTVETKTHHWLVKCQCGMNTGPQKSEQKAITLWNNELRGSK